MLYFISINFMTLKSVVFEKHGCFFLFTLCVYFIPVNFSRKTGLKCFLMTFEKDILVQFSFGAILTSL